jgi:hypothetical protein
MVSAFNFLISGKTIKVVSCTLISGKTIGFTFKEIDNKQTPPPPETAPLALLTVPTNKQTNKQTNKTNKNKPTNKQTNKQTNNLSFLFRQTSHNVSMNILNSTRI